MNKYRLLLLTTFVALAGVLPAQYGLQTGLLRNHVFAQAYNPANLAFSEFEKFQVGSRAGYWFGNVHAPLDGVFGQGNVVTDAVAANLVASIDEGEVVNAGLRWDLLQLGVKIGERKWAFRIREIIAGTAAWDNPLTLGLALRGNGPYLGDTISDENVQGSLYNARSFGASTYFSLGEKVKLGVRVSLIQGRRYFSLDDADYSLYTSENGTTVDLSANYLFRSTERFRGLGLFGFQGFGASVDVGTIIDVSEKMELAVTLNELGAIVWKTDVRSGTIELNDYEGLVVNNIFEDSLQQLIDTEVDSLTNIIQPDSSVENSTMVMPAQLRIVLSRKIGEKGRLAGTIVYNPIRAGSYTPIPVISLAYQHEVIDDLTLGAQVYGGGYDTFGAGLIGNYRFDAGPVKIDLLLGSDNILGWLAPSIGRGFSFFGGVGVQM